MNAYPNATPSRDTKNEIRNDIDAIKTDAVTLGRHLKEAGSESVDQLNKRAKETLNEAGDFASHEVDRIKAYVDRKPMQSLAIAFAAGFVLNFIAGRR